VPHPYAHFADGWGEGPKEATPKETTMTRDTMQQQLQPLRTTLRNLSTVAAALILTIAACYLLVSPPL
jgi:hypothetical protein